MEKYGFVYLWRDKKYPRFYIGSHWGTETDGYICSSRWMRNTFKRRPEDFKRRILARVHTSKQDLLLEEGKWLAIIPSDEIGKRYYNLHNSQPGHWSASDSALSIKEKMIRGVNEYWEDNEEAREKQAGRLKKQWEDTRFKDLQAEKMSLQSIERWSDPKAHEVQAQKLLRYYEEHPEARERLSKAQEKRGARQRGEIPDDRTPEQIMKVKQKSEARKARALELQVANT